VKIDLSSQVNQSNLVKAGLEYRHHKVFFESMSLQPIADLPPVVVPMLS
jgi:hypothetical protein